MRLQCRDLVVRYPTADTPALGGVSLDASAGRLAAVVGPSGSGKSTLLLALAALMRPTAGEVLVDGSDVWGRDVVKARRRLGVVFQFPETQFFAASVEEELLFAPRQQGVGGEELTQRVPEALAAVGLDAAMAHRSPFSLSGGEQRRVAIAAALTGRPDILLLDEPTAGLDPAGREALLALVRALVDGGRGAVVVSHEAGPLLAISDDVIVLDRGLVRYAGDAVGLRRDAARAAELGLTLALEDQVAAELGARGWRLALPARFGSAELARAIAEARA